MASVMEKDKILEYIKDVSWMKTGIIYLVRHGSKAYNCHIDSSDDDYKGLCVPPKKYYLGNLNKFEQKICESPDPDICIFELKKFISLAMQANPNALEILFVDSSDQIYIHPLAQELIDNRDLFISKKIYHTMLGYSYQQVKRIKSHRDWVLNPIKIIPERKDFGLKDKMELSKEVYDSIKSEIFKKLNKFDFNFLDQLTKDQRTGIKEIAADIISEMKMSSEDLWLGAARDIGLDDNIIEILKKEKSFETAKNNYKAYIDWKKNRNERRSYDEEKYGFDCYVEETEFLTENGFKKFDEINENDKLATVFVNNSDRPMDTRAHHLGIEYQNYTEKFDSLFNGNLYKIRGAHHECVVTPNHKMLVRKVQRLNGKTYDWELNEAAHLDDTFEILSSITPVCKNYSDQNIFDFSSLPIGPTTFMSLIGWYLSDGTISFRDGKVKDITISQIKHGKLYVAMRRFYKKYKHLGVSYHESERKPNEFNSKAHIECLLKISNKEIKNTIFEHCSNKENKRIPRWAYKLSKYKMDALLDGLMNGDGSKKTTENGFKYRVYYSKSKNLASDVQELALMCGYTASLYGPYLIDRGKYSCEMYHVHVNDEIKQFRKFIRSKNVSTEKTSNKRVVCFSVPNGTLITRLNGHINIHGNCKHAYHVVRLLNTCEEVLSTGKLIVKRPDREMYLDIRYGKWSYDQLMDYAENKKNVCKELYDKCNIVPHSPNYNKIDELCINLIQKGIELHK